MKREILKYPDERLRIVSQPVDSVTQEIRTLVNDMIETMIAANGIGLAAPQIGEHKQVVVIARSIIEAMEQEEETEEDMNIEEEIFSEEEIVEIDSQEQEEHELECLILINPIIELRGESITYQEGCLSVPEYRELVTRKSIVVLRAIDIDGNPYELEAEGLLAICIQHELDHLEGKLFIDRLSFLKRSLYEKKIMKRLEK